jgi:hypothetical protein
MWTGEYRPDAASRQDEMSVEKRTRSGCVVSIEFNGRRDRLRPEEIDQVLSSARAEFLTRYPPAARPVRQPDDGAVYYSWAYRDL